MYRYESYRNSQDHQCNSLLHRDVTEHCRITVRSNLQTNRYMYTYMYSVHVNTVHLPFLHKNIYIEHEYNYTHSDTSSIHVKKCSSLWVQLYKRISYSIIHTSLQSLVVASLIQQFCETTKRKVSIFICTLRNLLNNALSRRKAIMHRL